MVILQSNDVHTQLAELDPQTGSIRFFSRSERPTAADSTSGVFARVDGKVVCFYRWRGRLYVRVDGRTLEVDSGVRANVAREGPDRKFALKRGAEILVEVSYRLPELLVPIEEDPTPFVSEEDSDIFLFIANVLNDPGRRERVFPNAA